MDIVGYKVRVRLSVWIANTVEGTIRGSLGGGSPATPAHTASSNQMTGL
jgi:hypothetical protein